MKKFEAIISNTLIDRHGDKLTLDALRDFARHINESYIPINIEHDPRRAPIGRFISAEVRKRTDGEYEVFGIGELFENNDALPYLDDGRAIPLAGYADGQLELRYDRNFDNEEDLRVIAEVENILNTQAGYQFKKSLDPLSVLEIGGAFVAGGIASGLLGKIGSDAWDGLVAKIKQLMVREKPTEKERLLSFEAKLERNGEELSIKVLLTNPSGDDVEHFFNHGLEVVDRMSPLLFDPKKQIVKVVLEYNQEGLKVLYGLRGDGTPMRFWIQVDGADKSCRDN